MTRNIQGDFRHRDFNRDFRHRDFDRDFRHRDFDRDFRHRDFDRGFGGFGEFAGPLSGDLQVACLETRCSGIWIRWISTVRISFLRVSAIWLSTVWVLRFLLIMKTR